MTKKIHVLISLTEVIRLYKEEELSTAKIGNRFGVAAESVCRWLRLAGVSRRPKSRRFSDLGDEASLRKMYLDDSWTLQEIGAKYGVSAATVGKRLRRHGIPAKPPILSGKRCYHCGSTETRKAGIARGKQRFRCHGCRKYFVENVQLLNFVGD